MPYPIGGSIDIAGRMVAQRLADNLGQAVVVDNRTGAGGIVGTETGARAAPDGYTVLMGGTGTLALSPSLQKNLPYDPNKDFTPVTLLVTIPYVVVVQPSFKAANIKELIALAKAKPNEINYGSGGSGSAPHLAAELFKTMAGRLRPIGVTSIKRAAALPEVPTIAESGVPGYEVNPWFGVLLPARTPQPLVSRLNAEILKVLQLPATRERFAAEGFEAAGNTPAQFAAYIKAEQIKWGKVIKDAGIRAE